MSLLLEYHLAEKEISSKQDDVFLVGEVRVGWARCFRDLLAPKILYVTFWKKLLSEGRYFTVFVSIT